MEKYSGLPYNQFNGNFIADVLKRTFGEKSYYSPDEFAYVLDFLYPQNYTLNHHQIGSGRLTTRVPQRNLNFHAAQDRKWQEQILADMHPNVAVIKSRQLGITEMGIAKTLHWIDTYADKKANAGYFFPTYRQLEDFTKSRFNMVLQDEYLNSIVDSNTNSQKIKRIRDSYIYFRTSSTPAAAEGVDLSEATIDEYDRAPEQSIQSIRNSLKGNELQYLLRFSTPSAPGVGVDRLYDSSDQWYWAYTCKHCGKQNEIKYADFDSTVPGDKNGNIQLVNKDGIDLAAKTVAEGTYRYVCRYCGHPLDRTGGMWVPRYPERTSNNQGVRGYYISQTNAVWISASQLKTSELQSPSKQEFFNYDLGLPFLDAKLSVIPTDIYNHTTRVHPAKDREEYTFVTVGIDWGVQHSIIVYGMRDNGQLEVINNFQVKGIGATDADRVGADVREIARKLDPYNPDLVLCDIGDSGEKLAELMNMMGRNVVFGCQNNSSPTTGLATSSGSIRPVWNANSNTVKVDKLLENKRHISMIKQGKIGFYKERTPQLQRLVKHWGNVIIKSIENSNGINREVVTRRSSDNEGGDHYAQAEILANIAMDYLRENKLGNMTIAYDVIGDTKTHEPTDIQKRINDNSLFD